MIVAIDGPAGAGKSVIARKLAQALGFGFLDTGAMYRAAAVACLRAGVDLSNSDQIAQRVLRSKIMFDQQRVLLDDQDITDEIRTPEVSRSIRPIADNAVVRHFMVEMQRSIVAGQDYVTEGRDQATVAFPNAECKIYLTASPVERANRRKMQLAKLGIDATLESILEDQEQRDHEDSHRAVGALKVADDAVYVHTDGLKEDEVLNRLVEIVRASRLNS